MSTTPAPETIRATLDAYVAAYRANDKDALLALYAEDCEWTDPVGTPTHHGRAAVGEFWDGARALADAIVLEPKMVHICADEAAMVLEIHATIGGNTMVMDAVDVFTFTPEGQIRTGKAYWDMGAARPA